MCVLYYYVTETHSWRACTLSWFLALFFRLMYIIYIIIIVCNGQKERERESEDGKRGKGMSIFMGRNKSTVISEQFVS